LGSDPDFAALTPIFFPLAFEPRASEACGTRPSCIYGLGQSSACSLRPRPVSARRNGDPCAADGLRAAARPLRGLQNRFALSMWRNPIEVWSSSLSDVRTI
jgi:hypothetical protein